jgi:hypothetical protein
MQNQTPPNLVDAAIQVAAVVAAGVCMGLTARVVFGMRDGGSFFRPRQGPAAAARMPTVDATDFLLRAEDGVSGTTVVARDFYVEMFVHTKDRRPNRVIGETGVRALVEAGKRVSEEMDPMHTIEWSSFGGTVAGSKGVCVAFVRLPHDATGVWVGNVFATAFQDDIYTPAKRKWKHQKPVSLG